MTSGLETTAHARDYWARHDIRPKDVRAYVRSEPERHRTWVLDGLAQLGTVETVLEVGCHCGALLQRLEAAGYAAVGVDLNAVAVAAAVRRGLTAHVGAAPEALRGFDDGSVDAVVTSYALAYTAPADLPAVLAEMVRVSRRGLVLAEPMAGAGVKETFGRQGLYVEWRNDYCAALEKARLLVTSPPSLRMVRYARGPYAGINGVVVATVIRPH